MIVDRIESGKVQKMYIRIFRYKNDVTEIKIALLNGGKR